jgi:hypothetical protein
VQGHALASKPNQCGHPGQHHNESQEHQEHGSLLLGKGRRDCSRRPWNGCETVTPCA